MEKAPLINILCANLPGDVSRSVYNEYESRWDEVERIWTSYPDGFVHLKQYKTTVMHLLAMSTFYRRVLSGFDGARDFYKTISKADYNQKAGRAILIGKYKLDEEQYRKLQAVQISFCKLKEKFGIPDTFFEYFETIDFLRHCMLLNNFDTTQDDDKQEDLPF
jgi:hypothetical protein